MSEFEGKVVAITGAGGGLGKAHALEFAKRGANIKGGVQKSKVVASYGNYARFGGAGPYGRYSYGYQYGGTSNRSATLQRSSINRQVQAEAKKVRFTEWKEIDDGMAALRRDLTKKYNVEF